MENNTYKDFKFTDNLFENAENNVVLQDDFSRPSITFFKDVMRRLRKNVLAVGAIIAIIIILLMSLSWPVTVSYSDEYNYYVENAIEGSPIIPYYAFQDFTSLNEGSSAEHWFGTDDLGRDLYARAWEGGRVSLFIGFAAALMDFFIGVIYGCFSGFVGGKVDMIMMRITEVLYSIPYMLMVILFSVILGSGIIPLIVALCVTGWIPMARLVRGQTLQLKQQEYVQAAKSFGAPTKWMLFKHIIPNAMGPIIVTMTLTVPRAIFSEATLSFLGLGVQPPSPSWGQMASDSISQAMVGNVNTLLVPCILISLTMLSFNLLGDGLNDALDPKKRK